MKKLTYKRAEEMGSTRQVQKEKVSISAFLESLLSGA